MVEKSLADRILELRESIEESPFRFAGTLAHAINNYLGPISGHSSMVKMSAGLEGDAENAKLFGEITGLALNVSETGNQVAAVYREVHEQTKYNKEFTPKGFYDAVWGGIRKRFVEALTPLTLSLPQANWPGDADAIEHMKSSLATILELFDYASRLFDVTDYDAGTKVASITTPELQPTPEGTYSLGDKESCEMVILDDDQGMLSMYFRAATKRGIQAYATTSQDDAIAAVLKGRAKRVLSDFRMKGKNGVDVARELRDEGYEGPIRIVTGDQVEGIRGMVTHLADVEVYEKPFTPEAADIVFKG